MLSHLCVICISLLEPDSQETLLLNLLVLVSCNLWLVNFLAVSVALSDFWLLGTWSILVCGKLGCKMCDLAANVTLSIFYWVNSHNFPYELSPISNTNAL